MAKEKHITPKGTLQYPYLFKPDTKFNPDGDYRTKLVIPTGQYDEIKDLLDKKLAESLKEGKKKAKDGDIVDVEPYEIDEEDNMVINFKLKAKVTPKGKEPFTQKPQVVDSMGSQIKQEINVGSGTLAKIAFEIIPYFTPGKPKQKLPANAGLSLRLRGVKILKLVEYGGNLFGDDDEEGEYSYEPGDDTITNEEDLNANQENGAEDPEDF